MGSVQREVDYGHRLLPAVLDQIAAEDPGRVYAVIPCTSKLTDGFRDVSYADMARAVNRAAAWVEGSYGKSKTFDVLAYIGASDLRYHAFILGANKVGYQLLLLSPRNSTEGQLNLLKTTNAKAILTTEGYLLSSDMTEKCGLPVETVPSLNFFLSPGKAKHYAFNKTFEEAASYPFVIFHTSGSTGLPKAVFCKHGWAACSDAQQDMPDFNGYSPIIPSMANKRIYAMLPPFHAGGTTFTMLMSLWRNTISIWGPSDRPASAVVVEEILNSVDIDMFIGAPSVIEEMMQVPSSRLALEDLDSVGFGGGPISHTVGALLSTKTRLANLIGSTELSNPPIYHLDPEDWEYFHYNPLHKGIEFRPVSEGLYEQVVVRHPSTDRYHAVWSTFPELQEYSMNDLYTTHPSKPNLWLHVGRADDVIALSNGEKHNPVSMESTLRGFPGVQGALVVGQGRFCIGAILELTSEVLATVRASEDKAQSIEGAVWRLVTETNRAAPAHAQLARDKIILASGEKPFPRAGKGTVQRIAAVKLYEAEIDELYRRGEEEQNLGADMQKINLRESMDHLERTISTFVKGVTRIRRLELGEDFFTAGMDSLQVMILVKKLKASVDGVIKDSITTRLIYTNPTIRQLSMALKSLNTSQVMDIKSTTHQLLEENLEKFIHRLPLSSGRHNLQTKSTDKLAVLLTGSTGSLGSYLLHTLMESEFVSKIYCMNRREDAEVYQARRNAEIGLTSVWDKKVKFLHADLSKESFGIDRDVFSELENEVNVVIHNQWQVDFNLALSSYEPFILGTLNLIKLCSSSQLSPPIFFTSSIGSVGHWGSTRGSKSVPEAAVSDPSAPLPQGYSQSKWITERLLDAARARSGISSAVLRVGQIAGPVKFGTKGVWNKQEWLPSIIASSKYLGCIPAQLPSQNDIRWIPVDMMAGVIVDLVQQDCLQARNESTEEKWTKYYHLVNPSSGRWEDLVPAVQDYFSSTSIDVVLFREWVDRLLKSDDQIGADVAANPALKLIAFYESMLCNESMNHMNLDTTKTKAASIKMRSSGTVLSVWMSLWLSQWEF